MDINPPVLAVGFFPKTRQIVKVKVDVICDHQIDESVPVVISKGRAGREPALRHTSLGRDVRERAVAIVPIEHVSTQSCDVEVRPAIIVVVAYGAAHGESRRGDAGLLGYIREGSVVIIVVQGPRAFCPLSAMSTVGAFVK